MGEKAGAVGVGLANNGAHRHAFSCEDDGIAGLGTHEYRGTQMRESRADWAGATDILTLLRAQLDLTYGHPRQAARLLTVSWSPRWRRSVSTGRRIEELQMTLHAAEAAAQAAQAYASAGRTASARAASARAWVLADLCDGARTPALARLQAPGLTPRQYEIAHLAAAGLTNKQIAHQLTVSERTVGNHLQAAYTKLGASGRADLKKLIGDS